MTAQPDPPIEYHPRVYNTPASLEQLKEAKLSVPQVAEMLAVSRMTVYRLTERGLLRHYRVGHRIVVPLSAVRQYLAEAEQ